MKQADSSVSYIIVMTAVVDPVDEAVAKLGGVLMIVDDDEGVRSTLWLLFRDLYQVLLAEDAKKAIEIASGRAVDVVICDIRMPSISGIELLGKLKEIDAGMEVIMLTAYETLETAREALRLGACDYLSKPHSVEGMREAVERAMSRRLVTLEIRNHDRKLRELQREIHDRQLREELARTHAEIYASILHDINGPMMVIRGYVDKMRHELIQAKLVDGISLGALRQHINAVDHQIIHCLDISRRYLGFLEGRTHADAPVPVNQVFADLKELIEIHPHARENEFSIETLQQNTTPLIHATDLLSILLNLTINALQSCPEPHRVDVKGRLVARIPDHRDANHERFLPQPRPNRDPALAVIVQDNGPGMTEEV